MFAIRAIACALVALLAAFPAFPQGNGSRTPDVIFVPTPQERVEDMLGIADVKKGDVLFDLG